MIITEDFGQAEAAEHVNLSRRISTIDQLDGKTAAELRSLLAEHDTELLSLAGRIETADDDEWAWSARRALRALQLHKSWIERELRRRTKEENIKRQEAQIAGKLAAQQATQEAIAQRIREAAAAKAAAIKATHDRDVQEIKVFKRVALDVLGAEMYAHLWELTQQRIAGKA